jgi:hypothetical protein
MIAKGHHWTARILRAQDHEARSPMMMIGMPLILQVG